MATISENCQICHKEKFKYTCPRCNIAYCSVVCYKSQTHLKCSEDFYKSCIQEELTTTEPRSRDDMRRIYKILERIRQSDAGEEPQDFKDALDSDDDDEDVEGAANNQDGQEEFAEDDEDNIASRLQGIDINDADQVWQRLTPMERQEFQQMIENGDIMKLLPDCRPWWCEVSQRKKDSKIVELPPQTQQGENQNAAKNAQMPNIASNIRKFSEICQRTPSPCLHYNLWNILAAYASTVRFFGGELLSTTNAGEAAAHLVNLSATLKYGTNFEDAEDAIVSVEMEALTTGNGAGVAMTAVSGASNGGIGGDAKLVESRAQLQQDARQLMCARQHKLAALSDILQLLQLARRQQSKNTKAPNEQVEFHKLFAVCSGSVELNRKRLLDLTRKIEFLLSYVNRDATGDNDAK